MISPSRLSAIPRVLRRLRTDRSGLALLEFGYALPIVLGIGCYSIEIANLALTNLRISQIALNLSDNASRVGLANTLNTFQLREVDMTDVLAAARFTGTRLKLAQNGRITVSSLENSNGTQRIHWQRCLGLKGGANWDSSYGITSTIGLSSGLTYDWMAGVNTNGNPDNSALHPGSIAVGTITNPGTGMGDPGAKVVAPPTSGVIFVEVNYQYQPVISAKWLPSGAARLHYTASYVVRDNRDFTQIYNPGNATRMTCDKYTA